VKNIARLALFFSLSFAALFLSAALVRYLNIRIDAVRFLPSRPERVLEELFAAVQWALPMAVYLSLLLSVSYASRRHISMILSMFCLLILGAAFSVGVSIGSGSLSQVPDSVKTPKMLGSPGLILTQADNVMVLLQDPAEVRGSRVVSILGRPLIYQETPAGPNNTILTLPPVPLRTGSAWFLQSLLIDFSLSARQFAGRFSEGLIPFLIYTGALMFLLVSLRFIMDLSNWPLANLFLGALAFRGVLSLETFLNTEEVRNLLGPFLAEYVPAPFVTPLGFCTLGAVICLYTGLLWLARLVKRRNDEAET
jgi:hypothetical protein